MKAIAVLQVNIPIEYDEIAEDRALEDLILFFNRKYNKTSKISCSSSEGSFSWKLPKENAKLIAVIKK